MTRTPGDPCFFILGYGRSGTTLLRRMLSAHPKLFVTPENDVFQWLPAMARDGVVTAPTLNTILGRVPAFYDRLYDLDAFESQARSMLPLSVPETVVLLQAASRIGAGKPDALWGHKMPSEWPYVGQWREWFPNARFLHLVRHPHDSTASMVEYQLQRYPTTPLVGAWQWRKAFRSIRRHGRELGPRRYRMLHYEDLVRDPSATLRSACEFLGVASDDATRMIDFTTDGSAAHTDKGRHMARTGTALTGSRVGRSTADYSAGQAAMLDHILRSEMAELGYTPRSTRAVGTARAAALDVACTGLDVAWAGLRATRRAQGQL